MNCPYCKREVYGLTGLQELQKFEKHLKRCKKNPAHLVLPDQDGKMILFPFKSQDLLDALNIRAESGQ